MDSWTERAMACARAARAGLGLAREASPLAVVLGSGLGAFAGQLDGARSLGFAELPGFVPATVQGHEGRLVLGTVAGVPVLALQGRLHGYEGHDAATGAFPARVLGGLGARGCRARRVGADAVGMSTVPEVVAAAQMGLPACGISCLTNRAAGISTHPLSHAEVIQVAKQVEGRFLALLRALVPLAFAAVPARAALS